MLLEISLFTEIQVVNHMAKSKVGDLMSHTCTLLGQVLLNSKHKLKS